MTKTELIDLLAQLGLNPSRRLGQNFLIDDNMLDAIIRDAAPNSGDTILEIGPGTGVLTVKLLEQGCRVIAVEYDRRLIEFLQKRFVKDIEAGRFKLVEGDACRVDFQKILGQTPFRCISNLPYSIGTPVVMRLTAMENRPQDMTLLLQTEAAERFAARPNTKNYGSASVILQHFFAVNLMRKVPNTVFFPEPEVGSALVKLSPSKNANPAPSVIPVQTVIETIRHIFTQRRKRLMKVAAVQFPRDLVQSVFATMNLPPDSRAEALNPDTLWTFAETLSAHGMETEQ